MHSLYIYIYMLPNWISRCPEGLEMFRWIMNCEFCLGDAGFGMSLLWIKCWCPLLQGIARLCCDNRKEIRMSALTILQRSLLAEDLQTMTAAEWESCFNKVQNSVML